MIDLVELITKDSCGALIDRGKFLTDYSDEHEGIGVSVVGGAEKQRFALCDGFFCGLEGVGNSMEGASKCFDCDGFEKGHG